MLTPLFALSIILLTVFTAFRATGIIGENAQKSLAQEGRANALDVGSTISTLTDSFEVVANSAESISFPDDAALLKYLEPYLSFSPMAPNGIYIGLENGTWLDPSGWTPDADYVITERDWYKEGIGSGHFVIGTPYVDEDTGSMVVTMSRKVTLADGRVGVAAVDLTLSGVMDAVAKLTPMGKGASMLLDGENILSWYRSEFNGSTVSAHPEDQF